MRILVIVANRINFDVYHYLDIFILKQVYDICLQNLNSDVLQKHTDITSDIGREKFMNPAYIKSTSMAHKFKVDQRLA